MKAEAQSNLFEKQIQFIALGIALGLVLGFGVPAVTSYFRTPSTDLNLDSNTQAYILICEAFSCGKYADAKNKSDQAYAISSDPEIRYIADYLSRSSTLALNAGISSFEEGDSIEGGVKGFLHGFDSPMSGVTAWSLLFKKWFGDFDKNCTIADSRYLPKITQYLAALERKKNASRFSWPVFFGTPLVLAIFALSGEDEKEGGVKGISSG